jgi:hypothetical protein
MNTWQRFLQQLGLVEPLLPGSPRFLSVLHSVEVLLVVLAAVMVIYLLIAALIVIFLMAMRQISTFLTQMTLVLRSSEENVRLRMVFEAAIWPIRLLLVILALAAVRELLASLYCGSSGTPATASEFFVSICFIVESGEFSRLKAFRAGPGIAK